MKKGGKADWTLALIIAGIFVFSAYRGGKKPTQRIEVITNQNRVYVIDALDAAKLRTKLKKAGQTIKSIRYL